MGFDSVWVKIRHLPLIWPVAVNTVGPTGATAQPRYTAW